jgi:hypothetical protein
MGALAWFILGFLAALILALLLFWLWSWRGRRHPEPVPGPCPEPGHHVPSSFDPGELAGEIAARIAGGAADGSALPAAAAPPARVVWVDGGDEVLVHLDSTQVRIAGDALLVSVDLEADQTGRSPVVVALALGGRGGDAGLFAVTDEVPRGHPVLVNRWGRAMQDAVWASLLGLVGDHALERGRWPDGFFPEAGRLHLNAGPAVTVAAAPGGTPP